MKAAVIDSLERGPRFADFAEPVVTGGETLVEVTAAGLHPIVRMLASGEHYGSHGTLPMIPGIDGTGRAPDGTRVYFGGVRACGCRKPMPPGDIRESHLRRGREAGRGNGPGR
jgi:NADPH:quinone reductase-like Zn-dependent oxidoreductase